MTFTDDDLDRFHQWINDCYESDKFYCRTHEIEALLARLKAAEDLVACLWDEYFMLHDKTGKKYYQAWRKAAGE